MENSQKEESDLIIGLTFIICLTEKIDKFMTLYFIGRIHKESLRLV